MRLLLVIALLVTPWTAFSAPLSGVTKVVAGPNTTCAIIAGGAVKCWGRAPASGASSHRPVPGDVSGLASGVVDVVVGRDHACALTSNGGVKCWGDNAWGELGNGTNGGAWALTPVDVLGLASGVAAISARGSHTCVLTVGGAVKCWGRNDYGQLGLGLLPPVFPGVNASPRDVSGLGPGSTSAISANWHTCAVTSGGGLKCWGANGSAQLGLGEPTTWYSFEQLPRDVVGLSSGVARVEAGGGHTCALMQGGGWKCWGSYAYPLLASTTPVDIPELASGITSLSTGGGHTCVLGSGGGVKCFGQGFAGGFPPVDVAGLDSGVVAISAGGAHTCALLSTSQVKCWGQNAFYELGNGGSEGGNVPVLVNHLVQTIDFAVQVPREFPGPSVTLSAVASSGLPVTFSADTPSVCTISGSTLTLKGLGECVVTARQEGNVDYAAAQPVTRSINISDPSLVRLGNISTRGRVSPGQGQLIAGFVITGTGTKKVAIVATGPSLAAAGVANPLANPQFKLIGPVTTFIGDWGYFRLLGGPQRDELLANGMAPSHDLEAAVVMDLPPGAYTAVVEGAGDATGVSVVGVYELGSYQNNLVNISTRGEVLSGDDVLIAGFVVRGSGPQQVAIVATGPSLAQFGITAPLANPTLTLVRSSDQAVLAVNDDWQSASNAAQLQAAGFAPPNAAEAAILTTLPPGAYTAIVSGAGGSTGIAVVGVYAVP